LQKFNPVPILKLKSQVTQNLNFIKMEPRKLFPEEMEQIEGGWSTKNWLQLGCVSGGLALSMLSGPAFALTASLTIHACAGMFLMDAYM
jgi:hypothetical protein